MAGGAQGASGTGAAGVRSALKGASANGTLASAACVPAGGVTVAAPVTWRDPQITVHVPILMYHRVVPASQAGDSLPSLVVAPSLFEAQMAALHAAGWHSVTLRQLAADMAAGRVEPPRTFVATFDDGYRDGYRYAFPALRRYGFVGTYFVISGRVGMSAYLTPAELCALTRAGDEIGNHSVHHVALAGLSLAGASSEIADATRAIQAWTGVRPDTLAYPFGSWSFPVVSIVQRDGYAAAVTTAPGATETAGLRLLMPRVRVGPGTTAADLLAIVTRVGTP